MRRLSILLVAACHGASHAPTDAGDDAPVDAPPPLVTATSTIDSTRFVVREHMLAAGEMQISGEPFAEAMGRNLAGYSRNLVPPDVYIDPLGVYGVDLPGFEIDETGVHSTLAVTQYVLGFPSTDCGDGDTEHLTLAM